MEDLKKIDGISKNVQEKEKIETEKKEENEKSNIIKEKRNKKVKFMIVATIIIIFTLSLCICFVLGKFGEEDIPNLKEILVQEEDLEIEKETELSLFENEKYNWRKIIFPSSKGVYKFSVKNISKNDIIYKIKFWEAMNAHINMKYKLKLDNVYIKGNENEYVSLDELNQEDIILKKDSVNVFTLEWCWIDDVKDNIQFVNKDQRQYYTFHLRVVASPYVKRPNNVF